MRVWDLPPCLLCRAHLLGEHREIHAIYAVLAQGRKGYSRHPETLRWVGKLPALRARHNMVAAEMRARGYRHASPIPRGAVGSYVQRTYVDTPAAQVARLRAKGCGCKVGNAEGGE